MGKKAQLPHPAPPATTFRTPQGSTRVDLIMHRGPGPPYISVLPPSPLSNRLPVQAQFSLSTLDTMRAIPLSMLSRERCRARAANCYVPSIPCLTKALNRCSTPASLTIDDRRLAQATIQPWATMCAPRSRRFRPGWTLPIDKKAKLRSRLLRSTNPKYR